MTPVDDVEAFWAELLSGQSALIRSAWRGLEEEAQDAVLRHLRAMASEAGWHPAQRTSAQAALAALNLTSQDPDPPSKGTAHAD